jgi:hypothetical protein
VKRVTVNGKTAEYTLAEEEFMRGVVASGGYGEAVFLHELHATFQGRFEGMERDVPVYEQGALL